MKVLVVSGFLGAGKTTFISAMAQRCHQKFVVMENELGAVGVDGGLLSSTLGKDADIVELTEGCICCSMKSDFASSVLTIANSLEPECLLVEPTGVGMLSSIMNNLRRIAYDRIQLLAPVTIVDGVNCHMAARDFHDILADQITAAGTVVCSKVENISTEERRAVEERIRSFCPKGEIVVRPYTEKPRDWWESLWQKGMDGASLRSEAAAVMNPELDTCSLQGVRIPSVALMLCFLEDVLRGNFGDIIRAKGVVAVGGEMLRFDVAGGQYCITGSEGTADMSDDVSGTVAPRAVFIGRNLDRQALSGRLTVGL